MTPWQRELARIYDRLRKQDQRTQTYYAAEVADTSLGFRIVEDQPSPYIKGVKDALDAIAEVTVEEPDLQPDTGTVSLVQS